MQLGEIARLVGLEVDGDADTEITGLAPVDEAGPGDLTFVAGPRYRRHLATTHASAVVLAPGEDSGARPCLRAKDPHTAFVRILPLFDRRPRPVPGIHAAAVVAPTASLGERAFVGACSVVGEDVSIGDDAVLHPNVTIYPGVRIGHRFTAHAGAVVREGVTIGDDVVLQPGAVVGGDGFGFLPRGRELPLVVPQVGGVRLEDAVEVGANATVDRAMVGQTRLGRGVKLDNLVMVGHGSRIGAGTMLAAQAGLAGSTVVGERVMAGGQVGFAGHLEVGDDARLAARSGIVSDVPAGATVGGMPAVEIGLWRRATAALLRLPELLRRVRRLEDAVASRGAETGRTQRSPHGPDADD